MSADCIEWLGCRDHRGYGERTYQGKHWRTHRLAWTQAHGPIPPGMCVLHRCDNPPCINVDHLFLGTPADNARDRAAKGRGGQYLRVGDLNGTHKHPERVARGSLTGQAKLTEADIPVIRARRAAGETLASIARDFPVNHKSIHNITSGHTWRHVS